MTPAERLADYLAGELDADERATFEADLARDPQLRAQLDAMQRADAALDRLDPAAPPDGYEARLRTAVDTALGAELGERAPEPSAVVQDELAARRERRQWRWAPALAGAAAAIVVLGGVAVVLTDGLPGRSDDEMDVALDMVEEAEDDQDAGAEDPESLASAPAGPTVVVSGRDLDVDSADALLAADELAEVAGQGLDPAAGSSLGETWRMALEPTALDRDAVVDDAPAPAEQDPTGPPADAEVFGERLEATERAAIGRCLDELVADGPAPIPAYVEVARFQGDPAVVYGLVTTDPTTDRYGRVEIWVLSRDDCQVLRFSQQ